jgi:uncharacterized protein YfaT (DUF1175 family)
MIRQFVARALLPARSALLLLCCLLFSLLAAKTFHTPAAPPRLSLQPSSLLANGYDLATLLIESPDRPHITLDNPHAATIQEITRTDRGWQAVLRAGVLPGKYFVTVENSRAALTLDSDTTDSAADGTPDYLRLDDPHDQEAFRRWFTFLAEAQYFQAPEARPAEIDDCAALIRYAYREALRAHDSAWATAAHLPVTPAFESVAKYQYPYTPLGAALFHIPGGFAQFADAQTLQRNNAHFLTRDLSRAQPGDLLFFRQDAEHMPYHSMIFTGASRITRDAARYIVYHTGPDGADPGIIRRLTVDELLHYPEPDWRPIPANPYFLGVYRWNILRDIQ